MDVMDGMDPMDGMPARRSPWALLVLEAAQHVSSRALVSRAEVGRASMQKSSQVVVLGLVVLVTTGTVLDFLGVPIARLLRGHVDADDAAAAIGKKLREHGDVIGPVEVEARRLSLAGGKLRLTVLEQDDSREQGRWTHFHVRAELEGSRIETCAMGVGDTPEARFADLASAFVGASFAPIWSRFTGEPLFEARPFWGDEEWSVRGFHGFAGPVHTRGLDPQDLEDADFFSEIPFLPADGKLHLVKSVLLSKEDHWERSIEIDGATTAIAGQPWSKVPALHEVGMAIRIAVYDVRDVPRAPEDRNAALERLAAREAWLFPADQCPLDVMPTAFRDLSFSRDACRGGRLLDCVDGCQKGSASYCYSAALDTQTKTHAPETEALYLRACRLGFASGCTNAAAGRLKLARVWDSCILGSFKSVCERSGDPWACAMYGGALARGDDGIPKDTEQARRALEKSCKKDVSDEACRAAESILKTLPAPVDAGAAN
ncbi:MAG: hypothetical protein QM765_35360 [Myxococcales bacterium]